MSDLQPQWNVVIYRVASPHHTDRSALRCTV